MHCKQGKQQIPETGLSLTCRAILSDLDGTLVDSQLCVDYSWQVWAEDRGLDPDAVMRVCHGRRTIETVRDITPHLNTEEEVAFIEELEATCTRGLVPVLGAHQVVAALAAHQFAVITSGSNRLASHRLTHAQLPIPRVFITADDVINGKPHPEGYLKAAKELGIKPEDCIVLEDSPAGIRAGQAAGMRTIAIAAHSGNHDISHSDFVIQDLTWLKVDSDKSNDEEITIFIKPLRQSGTSQ
ncbi:MAG TPA: HAD-IA family hydrolase [Candidatus Obscuribacter sp.]|nr:HAD-IA family hydrolase [Candidatus Obscuribacter sp.]HMX45801.1 HAD-IA family hydrolase [Candidatus Obscuribacter sp.]HNG73980.1 HAD-IA family hydrolase [Candidatus Obscuribacter sp.]